MLDVPGQPVPFRRPVVALVRKRAERGQERGRLIVPDDLVRELPEQLAGTNVPRPARIGITTREDGLSIGTDCHSPDTGAVRW